MEGNPMGVALPEDALAEILRRLPQRSLAVSRCVRKAWRDIVDGRRLLLSELLPLSVRGVFIKCNDLSYPLFLSHPSIEPEIFAKIDFHRGPDCNGLILYEDMRGLQVANPATRWRAFLPPPPRFARYCRPHLVFDPTESLHYEVLLVPENPLFEKTDMEQQEERDEPSKEWPASTWVLCVFSSRNGRWEERAFSREGEAAGMASDEVLRRSEWFYQSCSAY